ncbi:MAG TPA: hypothetical protein VF594_01545, partial [Rubricoccaceae bacterium]
MAAREGAGGTRRRASGSGNPSGAGRYRPFPLPARFMDDQIYLVIAGTFVGFIALAFGLLFPV